MSSSSLNLQRIPKLAIEAGKKEISLSSRDKGEKEKDTAEKKRQCLWGELPEKLQEQLLERVNKQLRKERIDPLTGLPEGMTQDEFDEMNRATRLKLRDEKKLVKGREEAPPEPREGAPPNP